MSSMGLDGPARRVAFAALLTALVFGAALGLTVRQYGRAADRDAIALEREGEALLAVRAGREFWEETSAIADYARTRDPGVLTRLDAARRDFEATLAGYPADDVQRRLVDAALAANRRYLAAFERVRARLAAGKAPEAIAGEQLGRAVLQPLESLGRRVDAEVRPAHDAGTSARSTARAVALAAGLAGLLLLGLLGWYATRLIARLVERIRETAAVLAEATFELRAATKEAAAATVEQSSAVAETSATVEELAATASSIADNAQAVAGVAERTGETMRDMQEKVEAIAERSLSLTPISPAFP